MSLLDAILRPLILWLARGFARIALRLQIEGLENVPKDEALLVIGNHFSLFEPPLMGLFLPRYPRFLAATESQAQRYLRHLVRIYRQIPIWRGQVDRTAMRTALDALAGGEWVGIFPEGGVDPELQERIAQGEKVHEVAGHYVSARPGVDPGAAGGGVFGGAGSGAGAARGLCGHGADHGQSETVAAHNRDHAGGPALWPAGAGQISARPGQAGAVGWPGG